MEKGYLILKRVWENDEVELAFPMKIRKIYANLKVREDAGCVAFMRGPKMCIRDRIGLLQFRRVCRFIKENEYMMKQIKNVKFNLSPSELLKMCIRDSI